MKKKNILFLIAIGALLVGCGGKKNADNETVADTVAVKVLTLNSSSAEGSLSFSGTIEEDNATLVSFAAPGTVVSLNISEGQRISKGQYLGSVDPTQAGNAYESAKAVLAQAQDAYDRVKQLYDNQSVPEIKWVEVQSKLQQAKSAEQIARKAMADCRLYSPVSGIVSEKIVEAGQNVMPGSPVAKIVGISTLKAKISVPESEVSTIKIGQKAQVEVEALDGQIYDAVVSEKGIVANPISRSYEIKLRLTGAHKDLMPGMVARVTLSGIATTSESKQQSTVVIPANVVQIDDNNNTFIWTIRDGKACKVIIRCGEYSGDGVIVESGLNPGDKVIVEGQHKVCNGTNVRIQ